MCNQQRTKEGNDDCQERIQEKLPVDLLPAGTHQLLRMNHPDLLKQVGEVEIDIIEAGDQQD